MVLLFRYNSYQSSVYFSSANVVTGKLFEWNSQVESFFSLNKINGQLTQRNLYLERQVATMSSQIANLTHDSTYLYHDQLRLLNEFKLIPARVIANSVDKKDNLITIDKGSVDGIREDMGVACGNGIVGVVYMVSPHYSVVLPVLNAHSNVSVSIHRIGDNIVTSGFSSIFPEGMLVGKVLHVFNSFDGLSYRVQVRLATDFGNLRDVCVIDNTKLQEKVQLMRAAQDSIKARDN